MQRGFTVWFTGLPGSGKSTAARLLARRLNEAGAKTELLDGDVVRTQLSKALGFSREDRNENVRRIGLVCELLCRDGAIAIAAAIAPYRDSRAKLRSRIPNFIEVYMECPLDVLIERDTKGLYQKALSGEIECFTGVSDPYEVPLSPDVVIHSAHESLEAGIEKVWAALADQDLISFARSAGARAGR